MMIFSRVINKAKLLIILSIVVILSFTGLVMISKKISNYVPTVKALYCVNNIDRKTKLLEKSFILKDIPITQVGTDTIYKISDIDSKYAIENIYANEFVKKQRIGDIKNTSMYTLNPNEVEVAISNTNIGEVLGGTIRKDDIIAIVYTNNPTASKPVTTTEITLKNIKVLTVLDNTGNYIDKLDSRVASTLILGTTVKNAAIIDNYKLNGKIDIVRMQGEYSDSSTTNVVDGKIVN